ncbi:DinB family protein [Phycicoccus sonneratiae]|uniref:DinB family protein n=1 Tax=Phycicoccus sonneratiae TaxID=2807628 RepID=A0ABS2CP96_9MICO|nr:DinB family protein [Phycicoccus sonneraticus]MBM6401712.1 DinB family protein [Phycicoccus sonneraticus]
MSDPADGPIAPDTKDWTWVLERPCPDCGFEASAVRAEDVSRLVTEVTDPWPEVLARPDAAVRPHPGTWSPLEYACHVRDVCRLFDERLHLLLTEDDPTFANWDQDETATADRYGEQEPHVVGREVVEAAGVLAARFAGVEGPWWERTATRSDGSRFTALTLGRYGLHDLAHHLHDVGAARP